MMKKLFWAVVAIFVSKKEAKDRPQSLAAGLASKEPWDRYIIGGPSTYFLSQFQRRYDERLRQLHAEAEALDAEREKELNEIEKRQAFQVDLRGKSEAQRELAVREHAGEQRTLAWRIERIIDASANQRRKALGELANFARHLIHEERCHIVKFGETLMTSGFKGDLRKIIKYEGKFYLSMRQYASEQERLWEGHLCNEWMTTSIRQFTDEELKVVNANS